MDQSLLNMRLQVVIKLTEATIFAPTLSTIYISAICCKQGNKRIVTVQLQDQTEEHVRILVLMLAANKNDRHQKLG